MLAVLLVYGQTLRYQFLNYDDDQYFSANPQVQGGLTWNDLSWAFRTTHTGNWHPLTWLSLMLDRELFGPGPMGPHLTNILLHAANTVMLLLWLQRMTGAYWRSVLVAALFALHPLHVESVAWISERKDVLSGLFFMLTLLMYARYVEKSTVQGPQSKIFYGLTLLVFAFGLMCKPMLVTLPFVLLLLDHWPLGRTRRIQPLYGKRTEATPGQLFKEKVPFLVLAIASCVVTYEAQRGGETVVSLGNFPPGMRIANGLLSYGRYAGMGFWPVGLAVFYPMPTHFSLAALIASGAGLLGITGAVIWRARREPWLTTGWLWYLVMMVPVIGLVQVGGQSMADRYSYLPFVGLFMLLCWSVPARMARWRFFRAIVCLVAGTGLALCGWLSTVQAGYWKDSETLFRHALDVTRANWLAHYNLGVALGQAGRYQDAIEQYEEVLQIKPDYLQANYNLAGVLARLGRVQEAMEHWEQVLQIKPDYAEVYYNLGVASTRLGKLDDAVGDYEQALRIKPDYTDAHYNLGLLLAAQGRGAEAIEHYQKALALKPDNAAAHNTLGTILAKEGRSAEALEYFERALEIQPDNAMVRNNLGNALADLGRYAEAVEQYRQALAIQPDYAEAHFNLGNALALQGRYTEAIEHFQRALRLRPDDAKAQRSLNAALERQGRAVKGSEKQSTP